MDLVYNIFLLVFYNYYHVPSLYRMCLRRLLSVGVRFCVVRGV